MTTGTQNSTAGRLLVKGPILRTMTFAILTLALLAAGPLAPAATAAPPGGGGGGWDPLISTLMGIVPVAGALGMLAGVGIWASAGPNRAQQRVGQSVASCAACGLAIGLFAPDLAALFTQFI